MKPKALDAIWFSGRDCVGIVRSRSYLGDTVTTRYYIGSADGHDEDADIQKVADWGASFPEEAGKLLFGQ